MAELIIRNGQVVDGTGSPAFVSDIVIDDGRIDLVGDASDINSDIEWDAAGMTVCPGFIDIHSHSDFTLIANRNAESGIRQGITTVVTGNCGQYRLRMPVSRCHRQAGASGKNGMQASVI